MNEEQTARARRDRHRELSKQLKVGMPDWADTLHAYGEFAECFLLIQKHHHDSSHWESIHPTAQAAAEYHHDDVDEWTPVVLVDLDNGDEYELVTTWEAVKK